MYFESEEFREKMPQRGRYWWMGVLGKGWGPS